MTTINYDAFRNAGIEDEDTEGFAKIGVYTVVEAQKWIDAGINGRDATQYGLVAGTSLEEALWWSTNGLNGEETVQVEQVWPKEEVENWARGGESVASAVALFQAGTASPSARSEAATLADALALQEADAGDEEAIRVKGNDDTLDEFIRSGKTVSIRRPSRFSFRQSADTPGKEIGR